ncbi:O-antigen ligase family protein [Planctomycetota bacterium]
MKTLLYLLFIFGLYFKYIEFARIRLNIYIIILFLALMVLPLRALIKTYTSPEKLKLRLPHIFLLLISVLALFQCFFLQRTPNFSVTLIFLSASVIFLVTVESLHAGRIDVNSIFKLLLTMSLCSTVFVILQTQISPVFDVAPHLNRLGLATIYRAERVQALVGVRGRGLGITITDYAMHNFIAFFFALFMLLKCQSYRKMKYFVVFAVLCAGIIISNTASVFCAIAAAFVVWFLEKVSRWKLVSFSNLLFIFMVACIVICIFFPFFSQATRYGEDITSSSVASRLYMWSVAVSMFLENPLAGIGLGAFPQNAHIYLPHFFVKGNYSGISAHSMYFDMLAGGGIVGLTLFLGFLITVGIRARNNAKYTDSLEDKILYLAFIAHIVMGLFVDIHIFAFDLYFIGALIQYRYELLKNEIPVKSIAKAPCFLIQQPA